MKKKTLINYKVHLISHLKKNRTDIFAESQQLCPYESIVIFHEFHFCNFTQDGRTHS